MKRLGSRGQFAVLAIIMLVAIFFRTFRLGTVPGGLTDDEALWGFQATRVANGEIRPIFFEEKFGREPMYGYLVAALFKLFGPSILALRMTSVLVGIATVPMFYLFAKMLFAESKGPQGPMAVTAVLATSWLATSYWHVIYSRAGFEPVLLPFFAVVTFYFLWRAIKSGQLAFFLCAGLFLGASVYTYRAGRFLPIFVFLFLLYVAWKDRQFLSSQWRNTLFLFITCFLVVTPLIVYGLSHPEVFLRRDSAVSVFDAELSEGNPIAALGIGLLKTGMMFNLQGDPAPERNPGDRPVLDPLTSLCFIAGLAIAVTKSREREYAFVWLWLVAMCLPAALTILEIPNFSRAIGALPALYIPPAIAVVEAYEFIKSRTTSARVRAMSASFLFGVPILFAAATTYRDYFGAWAEREDLHRQFDVSLIEAANVMNQIDVARAVWIWPTTSLVSGQHVFSHPDFLYHGGAPYHYLSCLLYTSPSPRDRS